MTTTQRTWIKDFNGIATELEGNGAVRTLDDGFQFIDTAVAPAEMVRVYTALKSVGYAKGWI